MAIYLAACGLDCAACGAFKATRADDNLAREQVAQEWAAQFQSEISVEEINCLGCNSDSGPRFKYCSMCQIRTCAYAFGFETCAECPDYGCERLSSFFSMAPEARSNLEQLRL